MVRSLSERELQSAVVALARTCGWRVAHFRPAMMRSGRWATPMQGDPGFPDLVLVFAGRVLWRELKVGRGKLSVEQLAWRADLEMAGADYAVWTEADWPERIQAQLERKG